MMGVLLFIKNNWKWLGASAVTVAVCFMLHKIDLMVVDAAHARELTAQAGRIEKICQQAQSITAEVSNDYQTKLSALDKRLADLKRLQRCVPVNHPADAAGGRDAAPGHGQLPGPDGVYSDVLYDFAADAEKVRLQLIACQSFIRKESHD